MTLNLNVFRISRGKRILIIIAVLLIFSYWPFKNNKNDYLNQSQLQSLNNKPKTNSKKWFKGLKASVCEEYTSYASRKHEPYSEGPLRLSFMRPPEQCRTFESKAVESLINEFKLRMKDKDLFRIFENALPNTLDTTILWYDFETDIENPKTFISTGDIHAEWLRDSTRQLSVYQKLISKDPLLGKLIKGAILQQADFIRIAPYCNAFQPPKKSKVSRIPSSIDNVAPSPDWDTAFECKWELDSLASFLTLTNEYLENSNDTELFNNNIFLNALVVIQKILQRQSVSTFDKHGKLSQFSYSFRRNTDIGSETLPLSGTGNPVNYGVGLIRSAFRPSDDACIYQFLIPSNIQMLVELKKIIPYLEKYNDPLIMNKKLSVIYQEYVQNIESGLNEYAIVNHPKFGKVYAYEVDGFGGTNFMDDANIPSLLSIPDLGYLDKNDTIYLNTRKMVLSNSGNPYFLKGTYFKGIGGPHVGLKHAWPMSLLVQIRTSDDDEEILELLELIKSTTAGLGLMHEGIHVNSPNGKIFTRPWFSWCNSEFGKTMLDLAERKPWLIFRDEK
jgi:meiotically up-regulated gene 157 (Mug157) protein